MPSKRKPAKKKAAQSNVLQTVWQKLRWYDLVVAVVAVVLITVGLWYSFRGEPKVQADVCNEPGITKTVTITNDSFDTNEIRLVRCERLKVVNADTRSFDLAFGTHDQHIEYPGFSMQTLRPQEFFELNMVRAGEYIMHDHYRDNAKIRVIVTQ